MLEAEAGIMPSAPLLGSADLFDYTRFFNEYEDFREYKEDDFKDDSKSSTVDTKQKLGKRSSNQSKTNSLDHDVLISVMTLVHNLLSEDVAPLSTPWLCV